MADDSEPLHQIGRAADRAHELSRRQFMQLVSASAAALAASGCAPPTPEKILPYTARMRDARPGIAEYYATSMLIDGFATGLIACTREGRPIKIEGNPDHPMSLGATSVFHQAAVLQLYDPDRARAVSHRGLPSSWQALGELLSQPAADRGARLRLLLEPTSSPLVHQLVADVMARYPEAKVTFYSPLTAQAPSAATQRLFGTALAPQYDFARPDVIVALDADFLANPHDLRAARDFARRRRAPPDGEMNRLYVVEAGVSATGTVADQRLARPAHRIEALAAALCGAVAARSALGDAAHASATHALDEGEQRWLAAVAKDLRRRDSAKTLIVAGEHHGTDTHVLVYAINDALGNHGQCLKFSPQAVLEAAGAQDIAALAHELHEGRVDTLITIGGNPVYDVPVDLEWSRALERARRTVYCGGYENETARASQWFGPLAHPFETWGDGRGYDGTLSIVQPLIRTLHGGKSVSELLAMIAGQAPVDDYARLRAGFGGGGGDLGARDDAELTARFQSALALGFVRDTAFALTAPAARAGVAADTLRAVTGRGAVAGLELDLRRSPTLHDGRFANVSWLLELPTPVVKLTWDNAALLSPATAARLGIARPASGESHPMLKLSRAGRSLHAPAVIVPGHADEAITIWLGYGRSGDAERLARGAGFDAYRLRTTDAMYFATGLRVETLDQRYPLAFRQVSQDMQQRPLALSTTLHDYRTDPGFTEEHKRPLPTLMPEYQLPGPQWAMSIDLSMCTGCSACVVACQAENNVLVVGKEQVRRGRDMHWLRIDSYYTADADSGRMVHQPMMCQHCETRRANTCARSTPPCTAPTG